MKRILFLFLITFLLLPTLGLSQSPKVEQNLIILGNLHELEANDPVFNQLDELIGEQEGEVVVLFAGDFIDKDGFDLNHNEEEIAKLNRLMAIGNDETQLLFLPGDREWDNGKKNGLKQVKALQKYIQKNGNKRHHFLTEDGCPGPYVLDVGKTLRIVSFNTHWFVHEHKRPEEQDNECDLVTQGDIWGEFEDAVRADDNRNIVIATHHPHLSYGQYAGYKLGKQHLLPPIIGSFIAGYHQSVGGHRDLARPGMEFFNGTMKQMMDRFHGLIYASGHEYDIQVNEDQENYHINSGALAKKEASANGLHSRYNHKKAGLLQLRFFDNGAVDFQVFDKPIEGVFKLTQQQFIYASPCEVNNSKIPVNEHYLPCRDELTTSENISSEELPAFGTRAAGAEYKAGPLKRMIFGNQWRDSWTAEVPNIPYLDMDTTYGGLTAYAKGGSAQTLSVKLKSKDGQKFAFRSLNKDPTQKKDKVLVKGIYGKILQDYTSHHHPYGPLIMTELMAALDMPNPEGQLYMLPDHPALSIYREDFKGMLGWLEKRPKIKKKTLNPYRNANKMLSTSKMNKMLLKDNDHQLDVESYLSARLLDMWVADWDRHRKNFSYLGYGNKKQMTFYPFPKDRDKAFTKMDGIWKLNDLPMLAKDMVSFRKSIYGLRGLNNKSRNMDRQHLMVYSKEALLEETAKFQAIMTDEVIEKAVKAIPPEAYKHSGEETVDILKVRRDRMVKLMERYYNRMSKYVHFIGSNKKEFFEIKRLANGDVLVAMYKNGKKGKKEKLLKERLCLKNETKEIRLYGLGGKDEFVIDGEVSKSIVVKIVGGKGKDNIIDQSLVRGPKKHTKVYDFKEKDTLTKTKETRFVKIPEEISFEMDGFFNDDHFLIYPFFSFNKDDGLITRITAQGTNQKFNKPDFGSKYKASFLMTTEGRFNVVGSATYRHVVGKNDLNIGLHVGNPDYKFPEFFGYGNELLINDSLARLDYYENDMETFEGHVGLVRQFWKKSSMSLDLVGEYHQVNPELDDPDIESIYDFFPKDIKTTLVGPRLKLDLDLRDNKNFPTKGIQLKASNYTFGNEVYDWKLGGQAMAEIASFWTLGVRIPLTLGLRGGGSKSYGKAPFYYQNYLGQTNRLRGYRRNRFSGSSAVFLNTDLRLHIGTIKTRIVPVYWGVFGFYDSGRTFNDGENSDLWHPSYGGGVYIVPYKNQFNLVFTVAHSEEEKALFSFNVGFFVK